MRWREENAEKNNASGVVYNPTYTWAHANAGRLES